MYRVRTASPADLPAVIELVARLQREPAHHIAFHGETEAEVAEELAGLGPDWTELAVVVEDRNGRLRGVLSVEVEDEQRRAFLYGPYVDVPANHPAAGQLWQQTADTLLDAALHLPSVAGVTALDLFGHRRNRLLADFATRHDIPAASTTRLLTLTGADLRALLTDAADQDRVVPLPADPTVRAAVAHLHDTCFPNAPTSGPRLVSGASGHTVVVLLGSAGLLGYAAGYAQAGEHYVDVVGVDEPVRGLGAGRSLVRRLLVELVAAAGSRDRAAALVNLDNHASERMFTALGFTCRTELVSYHRAEAPLPT
ncbi:GNAT family N-acetyltransferase [Actinophytocola gossypii]|uniref:GNAT family N-acetyltransferase n=1 Tax=Actinophytocola gossypii TaxID=2812003 RepID=A0ABT2JBS2_9PSEU|nr:GNAT family N-acetyltransferase [Actinophytocola gossypii]MCT2584754.1 GNAT family N-acetyltransferase [Actinophytocola gossypii]